MVSDLISNFINYLDLKKKKSLVPNQSKNCKNMSNYNKFNKNIKSIYFCSVQFNVVRL